MKDEGQQKNREGLGPLNDIGQVDTVQGGQCTSEGGKKRRMDGDVASHSGPRVGSGINYFRMCRHPTFMWGIRNFRKTNSIT